MACGTLVSDVQPGGGILETSHSSTGVAATGDGGTLACMVNAEIGAVLAVMRRNARWGTRYMAGHDDQHEHSLMHALKMLRRRIFSWHQPWQTISPIIYLSPFLEVIRSDETGAPITGVALSAVYKILTLQVFTARTAHVGEAMHSIVDCVTSCRFEVTDPASEEIVLMKILHVLLACVKTGAGAVLSNGDVLNVVNTCFRVVHQAGSKGELLQRTARHAMHELVRTIFSRLPLVTAHSGTTPSSQFEQSSCNSSASGELQTEGTVSGQANGASVLGLSSTGSNDGSSLEDGTQKLPPQLSPSSPGLALSDGSNFQDWGAVNKMDGHQGDAASRESYGVMCMVEIFHFLCSLLNVGDPMGPGQSVLASDEDVPLFALGLINSALELGGQSFGQHPKLLALVQDELCRNLIQMGLSRQPLVLSMACSIVLNLYHHLRSHVKLQLEAFFSYVIIRLAQGRYGATYQEQEVAMEALVDFCRQPRFMVEMYANFDCDITCSNLFEDLGNLLSKSAFPVNCPLSAMHVLALEGLLAVIHSMADRVDVASVPSSGPAIEEGQEYVPFWTVQCENYEDPQCWVQFVRRCKYIKRRLMIGADHFNRDPKKGLEFLQVIRFLPEKLDPRSVACFFRYTSGLDKSLLGDFLGDPDEFCLDVLVEFARTFDFTDMSLDSALRTFLESFRLPGEAQKISRVLDAFAERYYEQSSGILANKDAAYVLAYSVIMLNTDQHNVRVKKKMSEEDFIKNNRSINGGEDLPREMLLDLYHSIVRDEIKVSYDHGTASGDMTYSRWVDLMRRSRTTSPYIQCDMAQLLDNDMFAMISGPTIAAISVVFDHAEEEEVQQACVDGFLAVAKIAASYRLEDVLDDLAVSLCKFTTLLNPTMSVEEPAIAFGGDTKARMAALAVFTIANKFGDYIRGGWRNILDCILRLHKLGLLASRVASDIADETDGMTSSAHGKVFPVNQALLPAPTGGARRKSSGLMSRFSQLLSLESEEPRLQPTEQQLAAHQRTLRTIEACHIDNIFTDSKFLQADSLLELAKALIGAAGRSTKGTTPEDEDTAVFCLELLIAITLNNRDRIMLLWQGVYEHMAGIVQTATTPTPLVEKAVFGLLHICQRLLPYKENLSEELLRSLQLILKLDARVADEFCERITQEVMQLVRANAGHIKSMAGWRTVTSLLTMTARHPEASDPGFEALVFIMAEGAHMLPANYVLCLDAARAFAESRTGGNDRSIRALDLLSESVTCLVQWRKVANADANPAGEAGENGKVIQELADMWLRLAQGLRKVCLDHREEVRNYALSALQRCIIAADDLNASPSVLAHCFDQIVFPLLDDLLDIASRQSSKEFRSMEGTLYQAMKFMSKSFLHFLDHLSALPSFRTLWLAVLGHMEKYLKLRLRGKASDRLQEQVPEILKNMLLVMHTRGVLMQRSTLGGDSLWEQSWPQVQAISPWLQDDMFPEVGAPLAAERSGEDKHEVIVEQEVLTTEGASLEASPVAVEAPENQHM